MILAPGIYTDVNAEVYFDDPCPTPSLTQSLIGPLLKKSPMHAAFESPRLNPYGPARESSRAMWMGEAVHRLALGRGRAISEIRYRDFASSDARAARDEAVRYNRIPVLSHNLLNAREMALILRDMIEMEFEGKPYSTEVVVIWEEQTPYGPIYCRAMLDAFCEPAAYILDPKVLRIAATADEFGPVAARFGYDVQALWYIRGVAAILPKLARKLKFANLVMESTPPHGSAAFEPDASAKVVAEAQILQAINVFAKCLHERSWPSYSRTKTTYSLPSWHQNAVLYRTELGT